MECPDIPGGKTLIGFCSATHGFNLPHHFLKLIFGFHHFPKSDVFIVNTRAGMKLSKLFLPGLSGVAQILPALVFWLKGYKVVGMQPVDLPSNWISLHPGLKRKVVDSLVEHWKGKVGNFTEKLLAGKKSYLPALISLPLDLLVIPLAFGYYFLGRFLIAKTFFASDKCDNCMLCIKACPTNSLVIKDNRPYWKATCESCMHCMNFCPQRAIEVSHNWVIPMIWLMVAVINPWISLRVMEWTREVVPSLELMGRTVAKVLQWSIMVVTFCIIYYLIHYLMHFLFFRKMMRYTSISSFAFWRRYRIPREKIIRN
jgi:Pyruvate/2-oxoacid:ferredoxin oxidoreductase delta subunit